MNENSSIGFYGSSGDSVSFSFPEVYSINSLTQDFDGNEQRIFINFSDNTTELQKKEVIDKINKKRKCFLPVSHDVWIETDEADWASGERIRLAEHEPIVCMANDDDSCYVQYFHSPKEVDELIKKLEEMRDEAWPN